jgi:hypothetical protein
MKSVFSFFLCFFCIGLRAEDSSSDKPDVFSVEMSVRSLANLTERHILQKPYGEDYIDISFMAPLTSFHWKLDYVYHFYTVGDQPSETPPGEVVFYTATRAHDINTGPVFLINKYLDTGVLLGYGDVVDFTRKDYIGDRLEKYKRLYLSPFLTFNPMPEKKFFISFLGSLSFMHLFYDEEFAPSDKKSFFSPVLDFKIRAGIKF